MDMHVCVGTRLYNYLTALSVLQLTADSNHWQLHHYVLHTLIYSFRLFHTSLDPLPLVLFLQSCSCHSMNWAFAMKVNMTHITSFVMHRFVWYLSQPPSSSLTFAVMVMSQHDVNILCHERGYDRYHILQQACFIWHPSGPPSCSFKLFLFIVSLCFEKLNDYLIMIWSLLWCTIIIISTLTLNCNLKH